MGNQLKKERPSWLTVAAAQVLIIFIVCALFAKWLAPYEPAEVDFALQLASPTPEHLLGCDLLGRDILSRLLHGAQTVLFTAVTAVALSCVAGSLLGLLAGYFGGVADGVILRFTEAVMAIPSLVLAMGAGMALGQSRGSLMAALAFSALPSYIRIVRGQVKSIRNSAFIQSAYVIGCSESRILFKHIFPNSISPVIVTATSNIGAMILAEASLSYLGVGIPPEIPAWGTMVSEGFQYLDVNPMLAVLPGLAIVLTVSSFSIVGDWLGDCLRLEK